MESEDVLPPHLQTFSKATELNNFAEPGKQAAVRTDLERLWAEHNTAAGGATRVESECLEVIAKDMGQQRDRA